MEPARTVSASHSAHIVRPRHVQFMLHKSRSRRNAATGPAAPLEASITDAHHSASRARVDGRAATLQCHASAMHSCSVTARVHRVGLRPAPVTM
jgi:hypothetical protein